MADQAVVYVAKIVDEKLDAVMIRLSAGDILGGRSALERVYREHPDSLSAIALAMWEFNRIPVDAAKLMEFLDKQAIIPRPLLEAIRVSHRWTDITGAEFGTYLKSVMPSVPPDGAHDAAIRMYTHLAILDMWAVLLCIKGEEKRAPRINTSASRAAAAYGLRLSEISLQECNLGVEHPERTIEQIRSALGGSFRAASNIELFEIQPVFLMGKGLALRDLGQFREALAIWQLISKDGQFGYLAAPLIAEAQRLVDTPVPSLLWRKTLADASKPSLESTEKSLPESTTAQPVAKSDCFIATAACGSDMAPDVCLLRDFRDNSLVFRPWGRALVKFYECASPPVASWIETRPLARRLVRSLLVRPLAAMIRITRAR